MQPILKKQYIFIRAILILLIFALALFFQTLKSKLVSPDNESLLNEKRSEDFSLVADDYRFEKFFTQEEFKGNPASVDTTSHPKASRFEEVLNAEAKKGPNFAG